MSDVVLTMLRRDLCRQAIDKYVDVDLIRRHGRRVGARQGQARRHIIRMLKDRVDG